VSIARSPEELLATAHPLIGGGRRVAYLLSSLLLFTSATLVVPLGVSIGYGENRATTAFIYTILIGVVAGIAGLLLFRCDLAGMQRREGFAVVAIGWALACLLGSLPFFLSGQLGLLDSWFESASGFTGTGASVIRDVEVVPHGILFWRSFTHWLGGMGFVVLYIALFPLLGVGAMQLYKAETPGPDKDRLTPRIRQTAKILWLIYLGFSVVLTLLLLAGGMGWFDALCQMFGAIGTGGFSTRNASIGGFHSAYIDWVITFFLWLAATNFALHWAVLKGRPGHLFRNPEWRFFTGVLVGFTAIITVTVWLTSDVSFGTSLRNAAFTVTSLGSTTGYATADYELWVPATQLLLFLLLFMGGCAGSTSGAMKVVRVQLALKYAAKGIYRIVHPHAVSPPRLGGRVVDLDILRGILAFILLYLTTFVVCVVAVSFTGLDFATAVSSVATTMGGVGPGLGEVGPTDTYWFMHPFAKVVITFCMLAGRLELFTLFLLFAPSYWRR
jgi:trk system potassium uptake protein TrkH